VTAFLIDEMFPAAAAECLRSTYGHDAVHVAEVGLRAADDVQVAALARAEGRAVVTENVADFAAERDVVLVFVLKKNLPAGGGQAAALARLLDRWAKNSPDPYLGHHWPPTDKGLGLGGSRGDGGVDLRRAGGEFGGVLAFDPLGDLLVVAHQGLEVGLGGVEHAEVGVGPLDLLPPEPDVAGFTASDQSIRLAASHYLVGPMGAMGSHPRAQGLNR
jgi:hypothetical protein